MSKCCWKNDPKSLAGFRDATNLQTVENMLFTKDSKVLCGKIRYSDLHNVIKSQMHLADGKLQDPGGPL